MNSYYFWSASALNRMGSWSDIAGVCQVPDEVSFPAYVEAQAWGEAEELGFLLLKDFYITNIVRY